MNRFENKNETRNLPRRWKKLGLDTDCVCGGNNRGYEFDSLRGSEGGRREQKGNPLIEVQERSGSPFPPLISPRGYFKLLTAGSL